jgi:hypothetical protein
MAIAEARTSSSGYQLKNDPPQIFFSTRRAILILIDREPVLRPVKDANLNRVINTRVLILRDESTGRYYLHLMDGWMESAAAVGPNGNGAAYGPNRVAVRKNGTTKVRYR